MRKAMLFLLVAAASVGLAGGFEFEARPSDVYPDARPAAPTSAAVTSAAPRLTVITRVVTDGNGRVINTFQTVGRAQAPARKMVPVKLRPPPIQVTYELAAD